MALLARTTAWLDLGWRTRSLVAVGTSKSFRLVSNPLLTPIRRPADPVSASRDGHPRRRLVVVRPHLRRRPKSRVHLQSHGSAPHRAGQLIGPRRPRPRRRHGRRVASPLAAASAPAGSLPFLPPLALPAPRRRRPLLPPLGPVLDLARPPEPHPQRVPHLLRGPGRRPPAPRPSAHPQPRARSGRGRPRRAQDVERARPLGRVRARRRRDERARASGRGASVVPSPCMSGRAGEA